MERQIELIHYDSQLLKRRVVSYLADSQIGPCQYRINNGSDGNIYTSCFALFIYDLFKTTEDWSDKIRFRWVDYINSYQDKETGYFIPEGYTGNLDEKPVHQLTCFAINALKILGEQPKHPFNFLSTWRKFEDISSYLKRKGCFEGRPGSGNLAMFLGTFLTFDYEVNNDPRSLELLNLWFSCHDETQNSRTGFWGQSLRQKLFKGFQNAFHQFVIYNYWERKIQYHDKIVDNILSLQDSDGFFAPLPGGGGCWDFDAADTLINCGLNRNYKANSIKLSLVKLFNSIIISQKEDGGFCESRKMQPGLAKLFHPDILRFIVSSRDLNVMYHKFKTIAPIYLFNQRKLFVHWNKKGCFWDQSDLWNTWFRCLTLAKIENALTINKDQIKHKWKFHESIGFGWIG
jgi:hypothetical protein